MTFVYPAVLVAVALLLPLAVWGVRRQERRRRLELHGFGDRDLLARSSILPEDRRRAIGRALQLGALVLVCVALARPQFGERPAPRARTGRDLLVLLDLSRSMNVADVGTSRLSAAKRAIAQVVEASPGDRVGLVVFGGGAFLQLPMTPDRAAFQLFLEAATSDDLGDPATDISAALETARATFEHEGKRGYQLVLLASDGESTDGDPSSVFTDLRRAQVPVFAIGVGTAEGGPMPADSTQAPEKWHRDQIGRVVISQLQEDALRRAAQETGGVYERWNSKTGVRVLASRMAALRTRAIAEREAPQRADRFQWPLALAVMAIAVEPLLRRRSGGAGTHGNGQALRRRRQRTDEPTVAALAPPASRRTKKGAPPVTAHAARLLLFSLLVACSSAAWQAQRGERLYEVGRFRESLEAFRRALEATNDPVLAYNAGNALYRMQRYEEAAKTFREVVGGPERLRHRSLFNLGNAYVRAAEDQDGPERVESLRRAVAAFEQVLRLTPSDTAAKWNLELALKRLGDEEEGGSRGRGNRGDYGRGDMRNPGYEGNQEEAVGAMAGGGYGSAEGESAEELSESQVRQLLEAVQREQLRSHLGRPATRGPTGERDW